MFLQEYQCLLVFRIVITLYIHPGDSDPPGPTTAQRPTNFRVLQSLCVQLLIGFPFVSINVRILTTLYPNIEITPQTLRSFPVRVNSVVYFSSKPKSAPSKNADRARDTSLL